MKKIVIVICYFGKWPWYFKYFVHTLKYNPTIDYILLTDITDVEEYQLPNLKFVHTTISDISARFEQSLGFPVHIRSPYKLCDFKPAYAYLFPELVDGYDFWGHGDIDILLGRVREFMTDEVLDNYDLIAVRHDYLTGYFQLFRNCPEMNTLFMKSKDYKRVFGECTHYCFDETNFSFEDFTEEVHYSEIKSEVESMMHVVAAAKERGEIKAHFEFLVIEGTPGELYWDKGLLVFQDEYEILLYHMIKLKVDYTPEFVPDVIPDKFFITENEIVETLEEVITSNG